MSTYKKIKGVLVSENMPEDEQKFLENCDENESDLSQEDLDFDSKEAKKGIYIKLDADLLNKIKDQAKKQKKSSGVSGYQALINLELRKIYFPDEFDAELRKSEIKKLIEEVLDEKFDKQA